MAEGKKKIMFYADWMEQFTDLTDEEAGRLIKHIMQYLNDLNPEAPDRITALLFKPFKAQFKRDLVKWEGKSEQAKAAAQVRWHKDESQSMRTHADASKPMRKNAVKDKVKDKVKDSNTIPSREEFVDYAISMKPDVNVDHVKLKYEAWKSNDWNIPLQNGKDRPIKNWKTTLLNTIPYLKEPAKDLFKGIPGKKYH